MARQLYRFYLYTVFIALLIFATVGMERLLAVIFEFTPLRGPSTALLHEVDIVQALVFAIVAWGIAGALGGLHYWLIQREMHDDPAAKGSAIRSFFLNITEASGLLIATIIVGSWVINGLGHYDVALPAAASVAIFGLVGLLEAERRRTEVTAGAAQVFQSLHFYGVQVVLFIALASAEFGAMKSLVDALFFGNAACKSVYEQYCSTGYLGNMVGSMLWFLAFWIGYGFLTSSDRSRLARFLWHGLGLAVGIAFILIGLYYIVQLLLLPIAGVTIAIKDVLAPGAAYDFVSPLVLGLLVAVVYHFWLRQATRQGMIEVSVLRFAELAIVAILSAVAFWGGCGTLLYNLLQVFAGASPDAKAWVSASALAVSGLGYLPLHFYLQRHNAARPEVVASPYRGFVFALLGGGILALALGAATALYTWLTASLGSPLTGWDRIARGGLAAALVGALLVALYLHNTLGEHLFVRKNAQQVAAPVASFPPQSIDIVLDDLLSGNIDRAEASRRLHQLCDPVGPAHKN